MKYISQVMGHNICGKNRMNATVNRTFDFDSKHHHTLFGSVLFVIRVQAQLENIVIKMYKMKCINYDDRRRRHHRSNTAEAMP